MPYDLVDPNEFAASIHGLSNIRDRKAAALPDTVQRLTQKAAQRRAAGDVPGASELEARLQAYSAEGMSPREEALEYYDRAREVTEGAKGPIEQIPAGLGRAWGEYVEKPAELAGSLAEMGVKKYVSDFPVAGINVSPGTIAGTMARAGIEYAPAAAAAAVTEGALGLPAIAGKAGALARALNLGTMFGLQDAGMQKLKQAAQESPAPVSFAPGEPAQPRKEGWKWNPETSRYDWQSNIGPAEPDIEFPIKSEHPTQDVIAAGLTGMTAGAAGQLLFGEAIPAVFRRALAPFRKAAPEVGSEMAPELAASVQTPVKPSATEAHPGSSQGVLQRLGQRLGIGRREEPAFAGLKYNPQTKAWEQAGRPPAEPLAAPTPPTEPAPLGPAEPLAGAVPPEPELRYDFATKTWVRGEAPPGPAPEPIRGPLPPEPEIPAGPAEPLAAPSPEDAFWGRTLRVGGRGPGRTEYLSDFRGRFPRHRVREVESRPFPPEPVPTPTGPPAEPGLPPPIEPGREPLYSALYRAAGATPEEPRGMRVPPVGPASALQRPLEPIVEVPPPVTPPEGLEGPSFGAQYEIPSLQAISRARRYRPGGLPAAAFEPGVLPTTRPRAPLRSLTQAEAAARAGVEPEVVPPPEVVPEPTPEVLPKIEPETPLPPDLVATPPEEVGIPPPAPGHKPPAAPPPKAEAPPREPGLAPPEEYPTEKDKLNFEQYFLSQKPEYGGVYDPKLAKADPDYETILSDFRGEYLPVPKTKVQELKQAIADNEYTVQTGRNRMGIQLPAQARESAQRWAGELRERLAKLQATERALKAKVPPGVPTQEGGRPYFVTEAIRKYRASQKDKDITDFWFWRTQGDRKQKFEDFLVQSKDPLASEAGSPQSRFTAYVKREAAKTPTEAPPTEAPTAPSIKLGTTPENPIATVDELLNEVGRVGGPSPAESYKGAADVVHTASPEGDPNLEWGTLSSPAGKKVKGAWASVHVPALGKRVVWDPQSYRWIAEDAFLKGRNVSVERMFLKAEVDDFYKVAGEAPTPRLLTTFRRPEPTAEPKEASEWLTEGAKGAYSVGDETQIGIAGERNPQRGRWELVDVADPIASHDLDFRPNPAFPKALQRRNRDRVASKQQVMDLSREDRFDPMQLGHAPTGDVGAPVLGPDDLVESGNGRTLVLRNIVGKPQMTAYQEWLTLNARTFGLDPAVVQKMIAEGQVPILIRRRFGKLSMKERAELVAKWNVSSVAEMSETELAMDDAARMTPELVGLVQSVETGDPIEAASNAPFLTAFEDRIVSTSQVGRFKDAKGKISAAGMRRARTALFAYVYGGADPERTALLARMAESTNNEIKNITNALTMAAPKFARLRADVAKGELYEAADLGNELARAAATYANIKQTPGASIEGWLKHEDLVRPISDVDRLLVRMFSDNSKKPKTIADILNQYSRVAEEAGHPGQGNMFGAGGNPDKANMLRTAIDLSNNGGDAAEVAASNEAVGSQKLTDDSVAQLEARSKAEKAGGQFGAADLTEAEANLLKPERKGRKGKVITKKEPKGGTVAIPRTPDELKAVAQALAHEAGIKFDPVVFDEATSDIPRWLWKFLGPDFLTRRSEHQFWFNIFRMYQKATDKGTRLRRMFLTQSGRVPFWGRTPQPPKELAAAWRKLSPKLVDVEEAAGAALRRDKVLDAMRGLITRDQLRAQAGRDGVAAYDLFQRVPKATRQGVLKTLMRPEIPEGFIPVWRRVPWGEREKVIEALSEADTLESLAERSHTVAELREMGLSDAGIVAYRRTQELLSEALRTVINPLRKRLGMKPLVGRKNYLPHKWLGNWEIRELKLTVPKPKPGAPQGKLFEPSPPGGEPAPEWTVGRAVMTEDGMTFDTEHEALVAAYKLVQADPNARFKIVPSFYARAVMEELPDTVHARALGIMLKRLGKIMEISDSEIREASKAGVQPRGFPAHFERRLGAKGYNKREMAQVIENYLGQLSRYAPMREAREAAHLLLESPEGIALRNKQPEIAAAMDRYIRSLHGGQTEAERVVDSLLKSVPLLKSRLGMRPTREVSSAVRQAVSQIKLGLFSTAYMITNLTQFVTHAGPVLGPTYAARGAKMYMRAIFNPNGPEGRLLSHLSRRGLIEPMFLSGEAPTRGLKVGRTQAVGKAMDVGTWLLDQAFFGTKAEHFNRGATLLGAFARLVERGFKAPSEAVGKVSPAQAKILQALEARLRSMGLKPGKAVGNDRLALMASDLKQSEWEWIRSTANGDKINHDVMQAMMEAINNKVNFQYQRGARPELIRGPFVELANQFRMFNVGTMQLWKNLAEYGAHQGGLKGYAPLAGHLGTVFALSGILGFPFFRLFDSIVRNLSGQKLSPMDYLLTQDIPQSVVRGSPALLGIDASRRLGYGDISPEEVSDLAGPAMNTVADILGDMVRLDLDMAARELAVGPGNLYAAWRSWRDHSVRERSTRARTRYIPTESELLARAIGFRPMFESRWADEVRMQRRKETRLKWDRSTAIDEAIRLVDEYEGAERADHLRAFFKELHDQKIPVTMKEVMQERGRKRVPQALRQVPLIPKALRREYLERARPIMEQQRQQYRQVEALRRAQQFGAEPRP